MARAGRRPGRTNTREEILAAARTLFAQQGYDGTSVRAIATEAGVNPAMIHHYFGAKDNVFAAALAFPVDPTTVRTTVLSGPPEQVGERFVRFFLGIWEDEQTRQPFLALMRSITANDAAARMLREFVSHAIIAPAGSELGIDHRYLEAAAAQMIGTAVVRYIVGVEPLASLPTEELVELLAPTVQGYIDAGSRPHP